MKPTLVLKATPVRLLLAAMVFGGLFALGAWLTQYDPGPQPTAYDLRQARRRHDIGWIGVATLAGPTAICLWRLGHSLVVRGERGLVRRVPLAPDVPTDVSTLLDRLPGGLPDDFEAGGERVSARSRVVPSGPLGMFEVLVSVWVRTPPAGRAGSELVVRCVPGAGVPGWVVRRTMERVLRGELR